MGSFLGAFILSFTVIAVVAIGILAAYAAVLLILMLFAPSTKKPTDDRPVGKPILVHSRATAAHAGGD